MFYALYKILDVKSKRITVYWRYSSRVESLPARSCIVAEYHPSFFLINPYNILFQKEFTAVIVQQYFRLLAKTPWVTQCKSHTLHSQHSSGFTHLYSQSPPRHHSLFIVSDFLKRIEKCLENRRMEQLCKEEQFLRNKICNYGSYIL